jgi:hypothetical protein
MSDRPEIVVGTPAKKLAIYTPNWHPTRELDITFRKIGNQVIG